MVSNGTKVTIMNDRAQGGLANSNSIQLMQARRLLRADKYGKANMILNDTEVVTAKYFLEISRDGTSK
jgi:hypothetical protein